MTLNDLTGMRFSRLQVLNREENTKDGGTAWLCVCDCGEKRIISGSGLRAGRNKSCGCSSPRFTTETASTHGKSRTRVYVIWQGMKARCSESATGKARKNYFLKGIRVCSEWLSFENFYRDMGDPPEGMSLERNDGEKDYCKTNCRWATSKEQANNTSLNSRVAFQGETKTVSQWADLLGIKPNTLVYRLRRDIPIERAMQKSIGHIGTEKMHARERACDACGKLFIPRKSQLASGGGKFCSQKCNGASKRASGSST